PSSPTTSAPPSTYTLSLHDALPILMLRAEMRGDRPSNRRFVEAGVGKGHTERFHLGVALGQCDDRGGIHAARQEGRHRDVRDQIDRKSTRLNSSHDQISYAVFCLKK